jgi:sterol desaturase/sphingolipid hydroxylase (fatty acid hydroxylase superfamily)
VFSVWDRLFGTLVQRDTTADERFGVPGEIDAYPQRLGPAFREPLRQTRTLWKDRRSESAAYRFR